MLFLLWIIGSTQNYNTPPPHQFVKFPKTGRYLGVVFVAKKVTMVYGGEDRIMSVKNEDLLDTLKELAAFGLERRKLSTEDCEEIQEVSDNGSSKIFD